VASLSSWNCVFVPDRLRRLVLCLAAASPRGVLLVTAPFLCALHAGALGAQDRLVRTFAQDHGLTAPPVWALAQDSAGFLWIGAEGGLFRFDGVEIRRWARETVRDAVDGLAVSPDGRVVFRERSGNLFEVVPEGVRRLPLPDLPPRGSTETISFDRRGNLWIAQAGALAYLDGQSEWRVLPGTYFEGERPRRVKMHAGDGVVVATDAGVWWVVPGTLPRRLYSARQIADMVSTAPDRLLVLAGAPDLVVEITPRGKRELAPSEVFPPARWISIVERNGTVWVALDRFLMALRPGERPEVIGQDRGVESGGPLLVDREGSLWLGSLAGLHQYPEPDTRFWGDRDGLPSRHTRFLARTGDALWVGTWAGNGYLQRSARGWTVRSLSWNTRSFLCADARGTVWTGVRDSLLAIRDTMVTRVVRQPRGIPGAAPRRPGVPSGSGRRMSCATSTPTGAIPAHRAVSGGCRGRRGATRLAARQPQPPLDRDRRTDLPRARGPSSRRGGGGLEVPASSRPGLSDPGGRAAERHPLGVVVPARRPRLPRRAWQPLPMDDLPTRTVFALVPSPRGGVWMVGHGILQRVRERAEDGWEVLERLTSWHGRTHLGRQRPPRGGRRYDLDRDLARRRPRAARGPLRAAPDPARRARRGAGRRRRLPSADAAAAAPPQPGGAPLRRPLLPRSSKIRHQVRQGPDEPWRESNGRPSFRWVDLRPGRYDVEYRASLDGLNWSPEPVRFAFEVLPPWYRTPWFARPGRAPAGCSHGASIAHASPTSWSWSASARASRWTCTTRWAPGWRASASSPASSPRTGWRARAPRGRRRDRRRGRGARARALGHRLVARPARGHARGAGGPARGARRPSLRGRRARVRRAVPGRLAGGAARCRRAPQRPAGGSRGAAQRRPPRACAHRGALAAAGRGRRLASSRCATTVPASLPMSAREAVRPTAGGATVCPACSAGRRRSAPRSRSTRRRARHHGHPALPAATRAGRREHGVPGTAAPHPVPATRMIMRGRAVA
jgi:hypothetical protein